MCGNIACIAAVLFGVDATYEPLPGGDGMLYRVQLEPEAIDLLRSGEAFCSSIPPQAGNVREVRITLGSEKLPAAEPPPLPPAVTPPAAVPPISVRPLPPLPPTPDWPGVSPPTEPRPLIPPAEPQPSAVQQAGFTEPASPSAPQTGPSGESAPSDSPSDGLEPNPENAPSDRPWGWLTLTFGLFASLGANGFLVWVATDFRRRYRALLGRIRADREPEIATAEARDTTPSI